MLSEAAIQAGENLTALAQRLNAGNVRLFVTDFSSSNHDSIDRFYSDGCKAVFRRVPQPIIVCNAAFLLELEAALRSLHFPNKHWQTDEAMFSFVEQVGRDPIAYLNEIRDRRSPTEDNFEAHMVQHMKLLIIFFGAHEVGHIIRRQNNRDFIAALPRDAPLEHKLANAVVKMCLHAEDFFHVGFRLDGFDDITDTESRVRRVESSLRTTTEAAFSNYATFFEEEKHADQIATRLIIDYFNNLESTNKVLALEEQQLFVRSLFFIGLYTWYKDLSSFIKKGCYPLKVRNSTQLMICMMRSRQQYVTASSLFGNVHRSTILRAYLVIEAIVEKRLNFISIPKNERSIWISQEEIDQLPQREAAFAIWRAGTLQNYALLKIVMDTPIKFSYVGCATGWYKELDQERGSPQLLLMSFETLEKALQRLLQLQ
ncbi:MAG: hypothetical protein KZQ93_05760 [Candidatus Thiodiazotropha sp. (ex Monitilora ramsayi)]|nr:hypothetical protein [Candidatus Thiodiazotropha sp. (ex Monitilora ramsayi)]